MHFACTSDPKTRPKTKTARNRPIWHSILRPDQGKKRPVSPERRLFVPVKIRPGIGAAVAASLANELWLQAPLLPPTGGPGKPSLDDRLMVSAFFYAEACRCSLDCLPAGYGNPRSLRTRRQRWQADGTMAKLMKAVSL